MGPTLLKQLIRKLLSKVKYIQEILKDFDHGEGVEVQFDTLKDEIMQLSGIDDVFLDDDFSGEKFLESIEE